MKRLNFYFFLAVAALFVQNARAQSNNSGVFRENTWRASVGPTFGILANPPHQFKYGIGAEGHLEYYPNNYTGITFSTGYTTLPLSKKANPGITKLGFVPVTVGYKGFVSTNFYLSVDAGASFVTSGNKQTKFVYVPSIGYNNPDIGIDVSFRYQHFDYTQSYINYVSLAGIHVTYSFQLGSGGF
ncbi:hypothetical protein MUY27_18065 [Mucilaginibacter sp. RS28]|uniref:Outer membrane protein beta-barrel domain-containing protein n=1 Tax=Mucilaginibacter straminoryzae TaxID=2932774 RepID=A0A9X1X5W7_9SPHI|nr:hypothetical protein [Mucilaginibacter straminoryzae]MCJ8211629.1 hypothetical protein [Mucilaginibacter straminoryzae]